MIGVHGFSRNRWMATCELLEQLYPSCYTETRLPRSNAVTPLRGYFSVDERMCAMTPEQRQKLIHAACDIRRNAHAPYSKFHVGAALLTGSGKIFSGCNVENASYGLTICAERSAVVSAVAAGEGKAGAANDWVAMAVATPGGHSPCGACRQVLVEFAPELPILLVDSDQPDAPQGVKETDLRTLLPGRFVFSK
jgi:cytidine deaminase